MWSGFITISVKSLVDYAEDGPQSGFGVPHIPGQKYSHHCHDGRRFPGGCSTASEAGMNGHLAKPIDQEVLYRTLVDTIGGH